MTQLLDFVHRDVGADVLVVTNMWPDAERPVYGIYVKRQVESLRAAGVRVDVLYLRGYRSSLAYPLAVLRFASASFAWQGRYRLVHVHTGEAALATRCFVGPPMLVTYWGDDVMGDRRTDGSIPLISRVRSAVVRAHASLFSATCTQSREMHDRLPRRVQRRNTVMPSGVDVERFRPLDRLEARRRLGWDPSERVVLFAATRPDSPGKRRWLAEAACAYAAQQAGSVRLHVAGSTPPDQMPLLMNAADCLIHTSAVEGSPNVIKEALMCNLPIVATPSGDTVELLNGVETSRVCPPDPSALGDALGKFLDRGQRSNGREQKVAWLSSAAMTGRLLDLYGQLSKEAS